MKIIIVSFFALISLNVLGQTAADDNVTRFSSNKDTLYILDPYSASTILSIWKDTYSYTGHTATADNGKVTEYWQTAPSNKPSVIVVKNAIPAEIKNYTAEHTVIVSHGDTIQSWKWKPNKFNRSTVAAAKTPKLGEKNETTGTGLEQ